MSIKNEKEKLIEIMLEKSQEAFLLAIEVYNKPTIKYKVEGFTFFICNAWELLLKAHLLNEKKSIYYQRRNKKLNRTISLTDAIKKIMTNDKDPVRINLESIVGLRNMANHLVIPEYATLFNDIFMACTLNYSNKLMHYFNVSINDKLPVNYITMFLPSSNIVPIIDKYNKEVIKKYEATKKYVSNMLIGSGKNGFVPESLAISYQISVKQVKNIAEADFTVAKASKKEAEVKIIHKTVDSGKSHPLSNKQVLNHVNNELERLGITLVPVSDGAKKTFTTYTLNMYIKKYKYKENLEYAYCHKIGNQSSYTYSYEFIQKIINDIIEDPQIFKKIRDEIKKKKN